MSASKTLLICWLGLVLLSVGTVALGGLGTSLALAGGMLAAGWVLSRPWAEGRAPLAEGLALCARYWHALLLLWLAVFGLLFGMTPGVVRELCTAVGIPLR